MEYNIRTGGIPPITRAGTKKNIGFLAKAAPLPLPPPPVLILLIIHMIYMRKRGLRGPTGSRRGKNTQNNFRNIWAADFWKFEGLKNRLPEYSGNYYRCCRP
jgi:hypothetical protein